MAPVTAPIVPSPALGAAARAAGLVAGGAWRADPDDAFDLAKEGDLERFGVEGPASLARFDAGAATFADGPALALGTQGAAALAAAAAFSPGTLVAFPLALDRRFARRRARVVTADLDVALPHEPCPLVARDEALVALLDAALAAAAAAREADERYDVVELVAVRERHKPLAVRHAGRTQRCHVLVDATGRIVATAASASAARREALERAKAGEAPLGVFTLAGRAADPGEPGEPGEPGVPAGDAGPGGWAPGSAPGPLVEVRRSLVARRATLRVSLVRPKADPVPRDGWLFVGRPAD